MISPGALKQFRRVFLGTTIFNLCGGVSTLWDVPAGIVRLFGPDFATDDPVALLATQGYWGLVLVFGFSYFLLWRDPLGNRAIGWVAVVGKTYAFAYWSWLFATHRATPFGLFVGVADLVFTAVILAFLVMSRDAVPSPADPKDGTARSPA